MTGEVVVGGDIRARGERASRFIEFFTATIRNRNTWMAYARGETVLQLVRRAPARTGGHFGTLLGGNYREGRLLAEAGSAQQYRYDQ